MTFQVMLVVKNMPANAGDIRYSGSIPGLGRSPGGGHGNPLQYSCLENPMTEEHGRLWSIGSQSWTWLKRFSMHAHMCLWGRANAMSLYQELIALVLECIHSVFIVSMRIWLHWCRGRGGTKMSKYSFSCRPFNLACSEVVSINTVVWSIWCHQAVCTPNNKGLYQHVWRQWTQTQPFWF